ncbi:MAG TPA: hypothetical protein PLY70_11975 [Saprospiraceae bacterium]|nr:hypothetical protein [Saprospiraceae bacterium]HPN69279.1 hypothetical protein [Saprospiraceae bacterium]
MLKHILIGFILVSVFMACDRDDSKDLKGSEEIIFGIYGPFCVSNCTELYKFKDGQLFEQKKSERFVEDVVFNQNAMTGNQVDKIINLLESLPETIINSDGMIGCAGCADEPILYFKIGDGTESNEVRVDTDINELPTGLQSYVSQLLEAIN